MACLHDDEASLQPEQREKHMVGQKAGREEVGRDAEGAQKDLDVILETLGSHGRSLIRGATSHLASDAAALKAESRKDWQRERPKQDTAGRFLGWSWRHEGPARRRRGPARRDG